MPLPLLVRCIQVSHLCYLISVGKGPGRGKPFSNGGAGHGGKGGMIFERKDGNDSFVYGDTYGILPEILLIGGSAGK